MAATTRSDVTKKEIGDIYAWSSQQLRTINEIKTFSTLDIMPDTLLYVVNFKNDNGYVLIAADSRLGDIIAVVDKGHLSPCDEIKNLGLKDYLERIPYYFASRLKIQNNQNQSNLTRASRSWVVTSCVGPIVTTLWHQGSPYNDQCPLINGQRAKAGCIPIAAGQIIAYHQTPSSYNNHTYLWSQILGPYGCPSTTAGNNSVALFIKDLGSIAGISYGLDGSGGNLVGFLNCFEDMGYQYTYPSTNNYSITTTKTDINACRPIGVIGHGTAYINGSLEYVGHAWVVSGYMEKEREGSGPDNYEDYVYCNWGWGGFDDGFFLSGVYNVTNHNATFDSGINFVYGITPGV